MAISPAAQARTTQTVNRLATRTTITVQPNPANAGQLVTLTATMNATRVTGTVTFFDGQAQVGTATLSKGKAVLQTSSFTVGSHSLTASYNGDTNNSPSTSSPVTLTVNSSSTSTALAVSPNPATAGQLVTLTATVSPAGATGAVTFLDGGSTIAKVISATGSLPIQDRAVAQPFVRRSIRGVQQILRLP